MKIEYSQLTDKIYLTSKNGKQEDVTQNFLQVMLLWFHETSSEMKQGEKWERSLREKQTGKVSWKFQIEKEPPQSEEPNQDVLFDELYSKVSDSIFMHSQKKSEIVKDLQLAYTITRK